MGEIKTSWASSSMKNKIGTILWALAGVLFLVLGFMWPSIDAMGSLTAYFFMNAILYIGIAVGLFLANNTCTSFVKVWAVVMLVTDLVVVAELTIAILVVGKILENAMGFDILSLIPIGDIFGAFDGSLLLIPILFIVAQILTILAMVFVTVNGDKKSRLAALLFCLFTGAFGGHCIYAKRNGAAALRIIFSVTVILMPVTGILVLIDLIKIICGKFQDGNKEPITDWVVA